MAKPNTRKPRAARASASSAKVSEAEPTPDDTFVADADAQDGDAQDGDETSQKEVWLRGLFMVIFAALFWVAQIALGGAALLQFGWLLFAGRRNGPIAGIGDGLADWLGRVALFQTGASEDKPFPFAPWGPQED